ncbi:MAG: hypothetical protein HY863_09175 [Chloroflexi bacterium]|nr:hypothetical protein [Chloroflexota bacterium]
MSIPINPIGFGPAPMEFNPPSMAYDAFRQTFGDPYGSMVNPSLHPSLNNYGQFSTGGSLHDTFKIDRYENIYGGHTTVDLGGNQQIHIGW